MPTSAKPVRWSNNKPEEGRNPLLTSFGSRSMRNHFMIIQMDGYAYLRITEKDNIKHEYKLDKTQLALLAEQSVQALGTMVRNR